MVHDHLGPPAADEFNGLRRLDVIRIKLRRGRDVFPFSHTQVVHHRHVVAGGHQLVRHVGGDEAGSAGNQDPFGLGHRFSLILSLIFNIN